jgi:hypothetical protein
MDHVMEASRRRALAAGAQAGILAGVVLAVFSFFTSIGEGLDPWVSLKIPSALFYKERVIEPGFAAGPVAVATFFHLCLSSLWGAGFAAVAGRLKREALILAGLVFGVLLWALMVFLVLPATGLFLMATALPSLRGMLDHAVFGVALAAYLAVIRREKPFDLEPKPGIHTGWRKSHRIA